MSENDLRIPVHDPDAVAKLFGDDAVVISPSENMVRMLNATGSRIWALIDGKRSIEDISLTLSQEFDISVAEVRPSVAQFVTELADKQLVAWVTGNPS